MGRSRFVLPDHLQDLGDVDINAVAIPPLLFTVMAEEEKNLRPIGKDVFYFENITFRALRAVHGINLLAVRTW